jgi:hypothetical protein
MGASIPSPQLNVSRSMRGHIGRKQAIPQIAMGVHAFVFANYGALTHCLGRTKVPNTIGTEPFFIARQDGESDREPYRKNEQL